MQPEYTCSVFIVPREVCGVAIYTLARTLLERRGFDIAESLTLSQTHLADLKAKTDRHDALCLEEGPNEAFIAVDVCPYPPETNASPRQDNGRLSRLPLIHRVLVEELQIRLRGEVTGEQLERPWIWSTQNSEEAWELLQAWSPERACSLREDFRMRAEAMRPPYPVIKTFGGNRSNAVVHLIQYEGERPAVCRVYPKGREHFLWNHLKISALSEDIPEVPPLLEHGDNWVVMPFYGEYESLMAFYERRRCSSMIPLDVSRKLFGALQKIHAAGYALLDLQAGNVLIDRQRNVRIIDFDHVHTFQEIPPFHESPMITGYTSSLAYDGPFWVIPNYEQSWRYLTGLDLDTLVEGSIFRQHACRVKEGMQRIPERIVRMARRHLKSESVSEKI